jgi:hypothetical protein
MRFNLTKWLLFLGLIAGFVVVKSLPVLSYGQIPTGSSSTTAQNYWYCVFGPNISGFTQVSNEEILISSKSQVKQGNLTLIEPGNREIAKSFDLLKDTFQVINLFALNNANPVVAVKINATTPIDYVSALEQTDFQTWSSIKCFKQARDSWYFFNVSTTSTSPSYLSLFNPSLNTDLVNVFAVNENGETPIPYLDGLVINPKSYMSVSLRAGAPDLSNATFLISSNSGLFIPSVTQITPTTSLITYGSSNVAENWYFAYSYVGSGQSESMVIVNNSTSPAQVRIVSQFSGSKNIGIKKTVNPLGDLTVDFGEEAAFGPGQLVGLKITSNQPILASLSANISLGGAVYSLSRFGYASLFTRQIVIGAVDFLSGPSYLSFFNPSSKTAFVTLTAFTPTGIDKTFYFKFRINRHSVVQFSLGNGSKDICYSYTSNVALSEESDFNASNSVFVLPSES